MSKKGRRGMSMTWNLHSISPIALRRSHGDNRPFAQYESHGDKFYLMVSRRQACNPTIILAIILHASSILASVTSLSTSCLSQVVPDVPPDTADAISRGGGGGGGGDFLKPGRWGTPSEAIQKAAAIHKSTEIPNDIDALVDLTTSLQSVRS
ncbi:hypothetical protein BHM03_00058611 [Ensete ventricosum]|nr:hypothetical protein BHM03_00058611 [Ensete ventricosum]